MKSIPSPAAMVRSMLKTKNPELEASRKKRQEALGRFMDELDEVKTRMVTERRPHRA